MKLVMPFMSAEASGKLADCVVAFTWKGRNVLRQWTVPTNPRDIDQKLIRQKFAAIGKNLPVIENVADDLLDGSKMLQMLKDVTPATQIWNAYFVKKALDDLKTEGNFTELSTDLAACESTVTYWRCAATTLELDTLTGDAYATAISPELILAMGAYAAYKLDLSSYTSVYSTYPTNWAIENICDFQVDYQTAA